MDAVIKCPACGGVIGEADPRDGYPCTCNVPTATPPGFKPPPPPDSPKLCCDCGKDLTGLTRYKDSRGYWCEACHAQDVKRNEISGDRCPGCGRMLPHAKLQPHEGRLLCGRCIREYNESLRKARPKVTDTAYEHQDRRRLKIMLVILGILFLLMLLSALGVIGAR